MPIEEMFRSALDSGDAVEALRNLAAELASKGDATEEILARFETAREQLRRDGREADEDAVMDVMDCLVGWCRPEMAWPHPQDSSAVATPADFDGICGTGPSLPLGKGRV